MSEMIGLDKARLEEYRHDLVSIWDGVLGIDERELEEGVVATALEEISQGIMQALIEIEDWLEIEPKDRYV